MSKLISVPAGTHLTRRGCVSGAIFIIFEGVVSLSLPESARSEGDEQQHSPSSGGTLRRRRISSSAEDTLHAGNHFGCEALFDLESIRDVRSTRGLP